MPVLSTKLHLPAPRRRLVQRARLLERLDGGSEEPRLLLVAAPAGFGKTTLLVQWLAGPGAPRRVAWLALDPGDADVRQFLTELPEIRSRRLAFNRGVTIADAHVVATPLLARDGRMIAAISAALDRSEAERLDDLGEELKQAVATLGPKYWPQTRVNGARRRR